MSVDGSNIVRVSDEKASELFSEGFRYVSKSLWKEKVRDVNKKEETKKTYCYFNNSLFSLSNISMVSVKFTTSMGLG